MPYKKKKTTNQLDMKKTGLNSEFSFSFTGCHIKVKELNILFCLSIAGERIVRHHFLWFLKSVWNAVSFVQELKPGILDYV